MESEYNTCTSYTCAAKDPASIDALGKEGGGLQRGGRRAASGIDGTHMVDMPSTKTQAHG